MGEPGVPPAVTTWSGREDLNLRLHGPEPCALPGCATPRRPTYCTSPLPRVLPHQAHELALAVRCARHHAADVFHDGERLALCVAERKHDASVGRELVEQRRRHRWTAGGHDDPVERRLVGPAERAAANPHPYVAIAEPLDHGACALRQTRKPLHRADAPCELGEDRRLIPGAGADLEHLLATG